MKLCYFSYHVYSKFPLSFIAIISVFLWYLIAVVTNVFLYPLHNSVLLLQTQVAQVENRLFRSHRVFIALKVIVWSTKALFVIFIR